MMERYVNDTKTEKSYIVKQVVRPRHSAQLHMKLKFSDICCLILESEQKDCKCQFYLFMTWRMVHPIHYFFFGRFESIFSLSYPFNFKIEHIGIIN